MFENAGSLVTIVFGLVISGIFWWALKCLKKDIHHKFVKQVPSLLTSIGILGTFLGITIGLTRFDSNKIDESISLLLSGLELAFLTSLFGILASVLFKSLSSFNKFLPEEKKEKIIELKDLYQELVNQNKYSEKQEFSNKQHLIYQKLLNDHMIKNQELFKNSTDILWTKLDTFSDKLSKSATDQIVDALNLVVKDFNKNLKEEFGENFKRLDESVKELVIWQREHKDQLHHMYAYLKKYIESLKEVDSLFIKIDSNSNSILNVMTNLEKIIILNQNQIKNLESNISTFSKINNSATKVLPTIDSHVNSTISVIEKMSKELYEIGNEVSKTSKEINKELSLSVNKVNSNSNKVMANLIDSSNKTEEHFKNLVERQSQGLDDTISSLDSYIRDMYQKLCESTQDSHGKFQSSSEEHVNNVGNAMAEALTTISEQFTDDYQKLVKEMIEITNSHKKVS